MKKIPTVFVRDWEGDRSRVLDEVTPGCEWVLAGEGVPTRKYDGTAVAVIHGNVFKRHEVRAGKTAPDGFLTADYDEQTGKHVGWAPASATDPADKWLREAAAADPHPVLPFPAVSLPDGTYELVGPKVQGNPERRERHELVRHSTAEVLPLSARSFDAIREYLEHADVEGIVFHHPDGGMAKIKARDFGFKRDRKEVAR